MNEPIARRNLFRIANAYAKATGATLTTVSREFYGKGTFIADFKRGAISITFSNLDGLLKKFSKAWPDGVEWPAPEPILMNRPLTGKKVPQSFPKENVVRV